MTAEVTASVTGTILLRARTGTQVEPAAEGALIVSRDMQHIRLEGLSSERSLALSRVLERNASEDDVTAALDDASAEEIAAWHWTVSQLQGLHMVEYAIARGDETVATLIPASASFDMRWDPLDPATRYTLSSFAYLRRVGGRFVASSPLCAARVELAAEAIGLWATLSRPCLVSNVRSASPVADEETMALLVLLKNAGILCPVEAGEACAADDRARELGWSFRDAVFHFGSRIGRTADQWYGAKPDADRDPAPGIPPRRPTEGEATPLPQPTLQQLTDADPPFAQVMANRRSIRSFGDPPVSSAELGEFLFRVARIQSTAPGGEHTTRPHPSGGGCYPLEIYVAPQQCRGVERGLYRYDPFEHALVHIEASANTVNRVIETCRRRGVDEFQVLFLITARLARLSWKYESVAYSVVLKDVGVLFQSMYLAATAMGLAPCAIGGGDSELVPRALGLDPLEETTVGEFALGTRL